MPLNHPLIASPTTFSDIWQLISTLLLLSWIILEVGVGSLGFSIEAIESDRGSSLAIIGATFLGMAVCSQLGLASLAPMGAGWLRWVALAVMASGLLLRLISILWLGRLFTRLVQLTPEHRLVTSGPFRLVRHPSYTGLLIFFGGGGMAFEDWLSLGVMLLIPALGIAYRIKVEEGVLLARFGDEYRAYMMRVKRLVPFIV